MSESDKDNSLQFISIDEYEYDKPQEYDMSKFFKKKYTKGLKAYFDAKRKEKLENSQK